MRKRTANPLLAPVADTALVSSRYEYTAGPPVARGQLGQQVLQAAHVRDNRAQRLRQCRRAPVGARCCVVRSVRYQPCAQWHWAQWSIAVQSHMFNMAIAIVRQKRASSTTITLLVRPQRKGFLYGTTPDG